MKKTLPQLLILCSLLLAFTPVVNTPLSTFIEVTKEIQPASNIPSDDEKIN